MAAEELTLRVLSPDGHTLEAEHLLEVVVPLADGGSIGIRPKHAPLIAETVSGPIQYQNEVEFFTTEILAGILSIRDNVVTILSAGQVEETKAIPEPPAETFEALTQVLDAERKAVEEVE